MSKPQPIWQEIPARIKTDIVSKLNLKSRCSLSRCSKSDQELVRNSPLHFNTFFVLDYRSHVTFDYEFNKINFDQKMMPTTLDAFYKSFLNIFNNPKTTFGGFGVYNQRGYTTADPMICNEFMRLVKEHQTIKFKVTELKTVDIPFEMTIQFLEMLDPEYLDHLFIKSQEVITEEQRDQLVTTEQWRCLKSFQRHNGLEFFKIEDFLHLERILVSSLPLSSQDVDTLIRSFCDRLLPVHAGFSVGIEKNELPIGTDAGPLFEDLFRFKYRLKKFPTVSKNHHLVVQFDSKTPDKFFNVAGIICDTSKCQHRFDNFSIRFEVSNFLCP